MYAPIFIASLLVFSTFSSVFNASVCEKNKPHADWTYLLMKVWKSAANERVNDIRTNERTNVKTISLKLLCEKEQRNMWKKSKENLQKRRFPAYFIFFSKIGLGHVLSISKTHLWAKIKKLMTKSWGNAKKTGFSSIFGWTTF